jgi:hypothetical protein
MIGGLRARAAANRRLTAAADIRLGVLLGVAIMISTSAAAFLWDFVTSSAVLGTAHDTAASGCRPVWFRLDQRLRLVRPGRYCTLVNCNPS